MAQKTLVQAVAERPFSEYADWWPMGGDFTRFMSEAIVSGWTALKDNDGGVDDVKRYVSEYLSAVYDRKPRTALVDEFVASTFDRPVQSGEFDALSYAFYRSAFERIARHIDRYAHPLERERRLFTKRVGKRFFNRLRRHLNLDLPEGLTDAGSVGRLQGCIDQVGRFLKDQGYLRTHFAFRFDVDIEYHGRRIKQTAATMRENLQHNSVAYALYEMGYPAILPSAVYLYHTIGEAQHHSSRTIEDLFEEIGYDARETDDFDPIGFPPDMVVELWEIRALG